MVQGNGDYKNPRATEQQPPLILRCKTDLCEHWVTDGKTQVCLFKMTATRKAPVVISNLPLSLVVKPNFRQAHAALLGLVAISLMGSVDLARQVSLPLVAFGYI